MVYFREVQPLYRNQIIWLPVGITAAVLVLPSVRGELPRSGFLPLILPVLILLWLFAVRLETEVEDAGVRLRFRGLWFPKTFAWSNIQSAEAVSYRPLLQYGGWGIHRGFREWAWNVSGSEGVRLHFRDGSSFLIGSAESDRLAGAIRERLAARAL
jgi:hypothetical protein